MRQLTPELLSQALRIRWTHAGQSDAERVQLLQGTSPGHTAEDYLSALARAAILDGAAFQLADEWHRAKGMIPGPTVVELEALCPGFLPSDYAEAISLNLRWAGK